MLKKFIFIQSLLALFYLNALSAASYFNNRDEVQYIRAEQVEITPEGIFIMLENEYFPITTITYAGEGYYCFPTVWICPRCETENPWYRAKCKKCRYSGF